MGDKFQNFKGTINVFRCSKMVTPRSWTQCRAISTFGYSLLCYHCVLHASKMTAIGKVRAPYMERILLLWQSVACLTVASEPWMEEIIRNWFGFPSPRPWQGQNAPHLF